MDCFRCEHYVQGINYNACELLKEEYFPIQRKCDVINEDGTINEKKLIEHQMNI